MKYEQKLKEFQDLIDYKFRNEALLKQALCTAQYGNQYNQGKHCKEFNTIGDIILKLVIALKVYDEGIRTPAGITLSKQILESNEIFSNIAKNEFNLDNFILSVEGEDLLKSKIIADIFEAVAGAIYLDSNRDYKSVQEKFVNKFYSKYKPELFENL